MKLNEQVCSLNFAKRLKELRVKQEGIFWWVKHFDGVTEFAHAIEDGRGVGDGIHLTEPSMKGNKFVAFTVAELGEMLPKDVIPRERMVVATSGGVISKTVKTNGMSLKTQKPMLARRC